MDVKDLTPENINLTDYPDVLNFAMTCADFFDNLGDMKFINTLPRITEEFQKLPDATKQRFVNMIKSHIDYFDNIEGRIVGGKVAKMERARQEAIKRIVAHHQKEIDAFKRELTTPAPASSPLEDVSDTKTKYSVRYETPAHPDSGELRNAVSLIKKIKKENKALKLRRFEPNQMEMREIIDMCRFKNEKCNNTKVGESLGIDPETAKAWIEKLGLYDYAYNPKHLK